ncbi:unnamed protein product, partial [Vitis vinifera]
MRKSINTRINHAHMSGQVLRHEQSSIKHPPEILFSQLRRCVLWLESRVFNRSVLYSANCFCTIKLSCILSNEIDKDSANHPYSSLLSSSPYSACNNFNQRKLPLTINPLLFELYHHLRFRWLQMSKDAMNFRIIISFFLRIRFATLQL